jgi:16S rRNA (uracil1498-N3)-methyltransferase
MAIHNATSQRLFVEPGLRAGDRLPCEGGQANYLLNVLRLADGASVLVFNGCDGEWRAEVRDVRKKSCALVAMECVRPQTTGPDVTYLFAPLKHARLDYMVQKAAEMGVARLSPVITRRTIAERVNLERMRANAIEAAEQCGILTVPVIDEPAKLTALLAAWDPARTLIFCDETAPAGSPVDALAALPRGPLAVLIGPEGGFDPAERDLLLALPNAVAISLGPRIMRADTAAVAALALVNAVCGRGW